MTFGRSNVMSVILSLKDMNVAASEKSGIIHVTKEFNFKVKSECDES